MPATARRTGCARAAAKDRRKYKEKIDSRNMNSFSGKYEKENASDRSLKIETNYLTVRVVPLTSTVFFARPVAAGPLVTAPEIEKLELCTGQLKLNV